VAGGPAVRRQGRGSRLTGWVEELQFFFFHIFFSPGKRAVIWGGLADVQWGFSFVLEWWYSEVVRGIAYFIKIQFFCF
jgi:hypothetical protein